MLTGSVLAGCLATAMTGTAVAQDDPVTLDDAVDDEAVQERVIVTGTRIANSAITASSPVTSVGAEEFAARGTIDVVDLINTLPGAIAGQTSEVSNGATGTSSLNLRGLGATRNLVLVDGKRLGPGRPDIAVADLNQIPAQLVERVDVVTGGASAVYGSDAIAGVANFILRRDFEGFEFNGLIGFNQDGNNNETAQFINETTSVDGLNPTGSVTDGFTWDISGIFGTNFADGRGNVTGYARYLDQNAIFQGDRDVAACALGDFGAAPDGQTCFGSNFGPFPTTLTLPVILEANPFFDPSMPAGPGNQEAAQFLAGEDDDGRFFIDSMGNRILPLDAMGNPIPLGASTTVVTPAFELAVLAPMGFTGLTLPRQLPGSAAGTVSLDGSGGFALNAAGQGAGATNAFNFNPLNFFQRPTQRINAGFLASYELHEYATVYTDFGFTRNVTDAQIAPTATFGEVAEINCNNPFLSAELLEVICTNRGFSGDDLASVQINRRFVEGGGRNSRIELTNYRVVSGVRGDISDFVPGWSYDVFVQFADTAQSDVNTNDFNIELLNEALQVELDDNGNPVCTSGRAGCLPLNLFGTTPVDPVAAQAVATPTIQTGSVQQTVTGFTFQGPVGITSPFASNQPELVTGFEWRRDALQAQPDSILLIGGSTGLGGPADPVDAIARVWELFGEVGVPLVEDQPFFKELSFTGQYRYSDYSYENGLPGGLQSEGFSTNTFSTGLSWVPTDDFRLRFQYQRAVRAPNIFELFAPASLQLFNASDPCSGTSPEGSLAGCVASGLPAGLFGLVPADAGQLQELAGGNVALQPEESDTFTAGIVFTPTFIPGLTASVDFFDIAVEGFITNIPSQTILDECIGNQDANFCQFINRDSLGTIQIDGFVEANLQNIGARETQGIDFFLNYVFDSDDLFGFDLGDFALTYNSTVLTEFEQVDQPGGAPTDCLGFYAGPCDDIVGQPTFDYRHTSALTWNSNYDVSVRLAWRFFSSVNRIGPRGNIPGSLGDEFDAENFVDIFVNWDATEDFSFNVGINNLFDNDAPFTDFRDTANGNTFPGVYDAAGRYIFFGTRLRF